MRKVLCIIAIIIIFSVGIFFTLYPYLYNAYTEKHHSMITDAYNYKAEIMTDEEAAAIKTSVAEFNESLANESVVLTDPFDPSVLEKSSGNDVAELLDVDEDGTISVLTVPRINIELPVRYGTSAETLARYLGLLEGSSLPIGGESTHAVITGHTGLPNTKLFTDLTELEVGDVFYLKTLKDTLAYEIDNISIVEPEDTELLKITKGQDYVTLLTCYPYGINSHRLLVRGTRVPYEEAAQKQIEMGDQTSSQWDREYFKSVVVCVIAYGAIFLAILFIRKRRSKKQR